MQSLKETITSCLKFSAILLKIIKATKQCSITIALFTLCNAAQSQVASISPTISSIVVANGGTVLMTATPQTPTVVSTGTGDRVAIANLCTSLALGASVGVSVQPTCAPSTVFAQINVGSASNSAAAQTFFANFSASQLAGYLATLTAAGQAVVFMRFFIQTLFNVSPIAPFSATRYTVVQVNLIEPPPQAPTPNPTPVIHPIVTGGGITSTSTNIVDVAFSDASTVQIRYLIDGTDTPLGGQFCTNLTSIYPNNGVAQSNPCASGSHIGLSNSAVGFRGSPQTGEQLFIPQSIARQAVQKIANGSGASVFYFVRQFSSGKYAVVQLRPNSSAANAALTLNEIRLGFRDGTSLQNLGFFKRGQIMLPVSALLRYQGAGMLRARWEVVMPSDELPSSLDLQSEANLSSAEIARQRRYRVLDHVNIYLPAVGQIDIQGPSPRLLPNEQYGQYLLLLRIETAASFGTQVGGAASVSLPVLRYYVGENSGSSSISSMQSHHSEPQQLQLLSPASEACLPAEGKVIFEWQEGSYVGLYRLEIEANGNTIYAARVRPSLANTNVRYSLPPFMLNQLNNKAVRWRVVALSDDGQYVGSSVWRDLSQ